MSVTFGHDWDEFLKMAEPVAFKERLTSAAVRNLQTVGREAVREAHAMIRAKEYEPNSLVTLEGKKPRTTPLINHNDLFGSIKSMVVRSLEDGTPGAIIGANKRGLKGQNIVLKLHEGVPKRSGSGWFIPPRPFLTRPANSPRVQRLLLKAASDTVDQAMGGTK